MGFRIRDWPFVRLTRFGIPGDLHRLWMEGKTVGEIATSMGRSLGYITSMVCRARKRGLCPARSRKLMARPASGTVFPEFKLPVGLRLFARYRGDFLVAQVAAAGVSVEGLGEFASVSIAAMRLVESRYGVERSINGWDFWRVRLADGRESFISNLRVDPELLSHIQPAVPLSANSAIRIDGRTLPWSEIVATNVLRLASDEYEAIRAELEICGRSRVRGDGDTVRDVVRIAGWRFRALQ